MKSNVPINNGTIFLLSFMIRHFSVVLSTVLVAASFIIFISMYSAPCELALCPQRKSPLNHTQYERGGISPLMFPFGIMLNIFLMLSTNLHF